MKIQDLSLYTISLPFRFSFKHSLAERSCSHNIIVKARVLSDNGTVHTGYGEGIPRDYVTGEKIEQSEAIIKNIYFPLFINQRFSDSLELVAFLKEQIKNLASANKSVGAFWCALETALLDASCKNDDITMVDLLGNQLENNSIRYGAVVPFSNKKALLAMLLFYKLYGFSTVKIKVGQDLNKDINNIRWARLIMGDQATLRVDANCAWSVKQTIAFAQLAQPYNIASIEQPLPADDTDGLLELAASLPQVIVLDESLCTIKQAKFYADKKMDNNDLNIEFNIRLSKVGGLISAAQMVAIAQAASIKCHLGAQVGESGILTATARAFAISKGSFVNHEGAANCFLLRQDLTKENLTFAYRGLGKLPANGNGLGITVEDKHLLRLSKENKITAKATPVAKHASL